MSNMPVRSMTQQRGAALVLVMWVVILAGLMLLGVLKSVRAHRALAHAELAAVQSHWLARAGIEQAMAVLEEDDRTCDSTLERWYEDASSFENVQVGSSGWFSVRSAADHNRPGIDDESARLNLNTADKRQLTELKELSDIQIDSLIDWRSPSETPQGDGAKAGYYRHLRFPYELRGKDLQTHRELLLVRGFEDRRFFGKASALAATGPGALTTIYSYEPNRDPMGLPRVNLNSASAQILQERLKFAPQLAQAVLRQRSTRPFQDLAGLLEIQPQQAPRASAPPEAPSRGGDDLVEQITLDWLAKHIEQISLSEDARLPGKINLNTASRDVLLTLPGMTGEIADRMITQRASGNGVFRSLADLLERHVMEQNVFQGLFEKVTVRSDVFTVESVGVSASGTQRTILAVIDRGSKPFSIIYWCQSP